MRSERYASSWDALEDTPESAQNMHLRSSLMRDISRRIGGWECPEGVSAKRLGITLPHLEEFWTGRIGKFTMDDLLSMRAPDSA